MKAGRTKKAPRLCKVYHSSRPCATNGSKSHLPAQVECKFKLHICAIKTCICPRRAVYWETKVVLPLKLGGGRGTPNE